MTDATDRFEALAAAFYADTGMLAPGKDQPAAMGGPSYDDRYAAWNAWLAARRTVDPLPPPAPIHRPGTPEHPLTLTAKGRALLDVPRCAACGVGRGAHVWINAQQDAACPTSSVGAMTFYRAADPIPDGCRRPNSGCEWPRCGCGGGAG